MAGTVETVSTINSFLRTLLAIVVLGGAGTAGWYGYSTYNAKEIEAQQKARQLAEAEGKLAQAATDLATAQADIQLKAEAIDQLNLEVEKLSTSLKLLKVDHRVAKMTVVDQTKDDATGQIITLVEFVELNDEGQPIDTPRRFPIPGDTVYVDGWVVKFDDKYIEAADLERGTSLIVFKRLFGSNQKPDEGFPLDEQGRSAKSLRPRRPDERLRAEDFRRLLEHRQRRRQGRPAWHPRRPRRRPLHQGPKREDLQDSASRQRRPLDRARRASHSLSGPTAAPGQTRRRRPGAAGAREAGRRGGTWAVGGNSRRAEPGQSRRTGWRRPEPRPAGVRPGCGRR